MIKELDDLLKELRETEPDAQEVMAGLSEAQLTWRPKRRKWSIAEHLAHLIQVNQLYVPAIEDAISTAKEMGWRSDGPYHYNFFTRIAVSTTEPPVKLRLRAPKRMHPPARILTVRLLPNLKASHDKLAQLMQRANGLDLAKAKVPSPVTTLIKFNLGGLFNLLAAHNRRHLWHCWNIRNLPDFPPKEGKQG